MQRQANGYLNPAILLRRSTKMKIHLNTTIALFLILFSLDIQAKSGQFTRRVVEKLNIVYGDSQVTLLDNKSIEIKLDAPIDDNSEPLGARLEHVEEASKGRVCASIKTQAVSGNVFAMYLTSKEPKDRSTEKWDELDFEFTGRSPTTVWTNVFHDGSDSGQGQDIALGFNSDEKEARYCIDWEIGNQAEWSVDGKSIRTISLEGWTKRMHATFSFWGQKRVGGGLDGFAGTQELRPPNSLRATAKLIKTDYQGDIGPSVLE
jgi:hypothetical protein